MTPRYTRGREIAGLTLAQALGRLGWNAGDTLLERIESGATRPSAALHLKLARLYGVTPAWLRGAAPVLPPAAVKLILHNPRLSDVDRAGLLELLGAIYTPEPS